jgi:zinc transporter ZupT
VVVVILLAFSTFVSTAVGGLFALRHRDRLHLILGFTAGVILGVVAFDVFPEIFDLAHGHGGNIDAAMLAMIGGFLIFHIVEKSLLLHSAHEDEYGRHHHPHVGVASALALAGHSFADGVAIGLAFQASGSVGVAVAIAVIAHDFADGLNTVSLALAHGNSRRRATLLLALDALAPVLGAASTLLVHVSTPGLLIYLGFFAGFLLYVGAADILPEAHSPHPSLPTLGLTIAGAGLMYVVSTATP